MYWFLHFGIRANAFTFTQNARILHRLGDKSTELVVIAVDCPQVVAVYYKSVYCDPLNSVRFVVDLSYNLFL